MPTIKAPNKRPQDTFQNFQYIIYHTSHENQNNSYQREEYDMRNTYVFCYFVHDKSIVSRVWDIYIYIRGGEFINEMEYLAR